MHKLGFISALGCAALLAGAGPARAQDVGYLREMPDAQQVVDDMRGVSDRDSAARAGVALQSLANFIVALSNGRAERDALTPAEAVRLQSYAEAANAVLQAEAAKADQGCQGNACDKYMLPRCQSAYLFSPVFARQLLDRYFSAEWQSQYGERLRGTIWRDALALPAGGTGSAIPPEAQAICAGETKPPSLLSRVLGGGGQSPSKTVPSATGGSLFGGLPSLLFGALVLAWIGWKVYNARPFAVRRSNRAALAEFGADQASREHAILEAFESPDHVFRYTGTNRNSGHKMGFTLLRAVKSFRRGDLEALRFAYLAFNRGLIDDEKFHWYRFSAVWGRGVTDPSEWKFLGLRGLLRASRGAIDAARASVADFAQANAGADIESQALAAAQQVARQNPQDPVFRDTLRRFVDGAYWLTTSDIKRSIFAPADSRYSLVFGTLDGTDVELAYSGDGSVLTVAPPGSGKTQCNVVPNLLRWPGPAVVLDVKGEIHDLTSNWRAANVGPVIRFSPLDPARSACFNPLTEVRGDPLYVWEDARFLASMMIVPTAKEPFWEDKAREVLTAIIADVAYWNPPEARPMASVLSIVNRNGWKEFVDRLRKNPQVATMRDEGANLAQMEPKTLDGALQTAKASLAAWAGERIARITARSDWSASDLRAGGNPTIYICVKPSELDAYLSLLRVVIAQHIRSLTSGDLPPRGAAPILFVLDELPRLKHMPPVEEALEVGRGYGIKLWMFAQSVGQLRTAYPNADGMMGSCAVRTFMNPTLQDGTAKMVAEQIGYRTGEEHGGKDRGAESQQRLVVEATQLAGPDYKNLQIVMGTGSKPARVQKRFAYEDPRLADKLGALDGAARTGAEA